MSILKKPFTQINATTKQLDVNKDIKIKIGDEKQSEFFPRAKIEKWDNEVNFSIGIKELPEATDVVEDKDGVISWKRGDKKVRFYEKDRFMPEQVSELDRLFKQIHEPESGEMFEMDIVFDTKPASNVVDFSIETKGLDFLYQGELTEGEKSKGYRRPENILGSYAVYHKDRAKAKRNAGKYEIGKAFHIYRPYATDANGDRVWCEINIDTENNEAKVTVPQDFIDNAAYPIVVDPTFGYTSIGASSVQIGGNSVGNRIGFLENLPEDGDVESVTVYLSASASYTTRAAYIYGGSAGSVGSLLATTNTATVATAAAWNTFTFATAYSATSGDFWLQSPFSGDNGKSAPRLTIYYDTGGATNEGAQYASDAGYTYNTNIYSIYATYSVASTDIEAERDAEVFGGSEDGRLFGCEDLEGETLPASFDSVAVRFGSGTVTLDTTGKVNGDDSIEFVNTAEAGIDARFNAGQDYDEIWVKVSGFFPTGFAFGVSGYSGFINILNSALSISAMNFNIEDYGTIRLTANNGSLGYTNTAIDLPVNQVFSLQVRILQAGPSGRLQIWLDNDVEGSPDYDSGVVNLGSYDQRIFQFGKTYVPEAVDEYYLDDVCVDNAFIEAPAASTDVNDERDAEVSGIDTATAERDAEVTGTDTTEAERDAEVSGVNTSTAERDAEVSGVDASNAERDAEIFGSLGADSERDAEVTGEDTATAERDAEVSGSDTATAERDAEIDGSLGANASRDAEVTGTDTATAERDAEVTGEDTATTERDAEVTGTDTTEAERDAEVTGSDTATDERDAEVTGSLRSNDERDAEVTGSDSATAERDAEVYGSVTSTANRDAEISGDGGEADERSAEVTGVDTTEAERDAEIEGALGANAERDAEVTGSLGANAERDAEIDGSDTATAERDSEVSGVDTTEAERDAEISGSVDVTTERDAEIDGSDTATAERDAEISGVFVSNDERDAEIDGALVASAERGALISGDSGDPYCPLPTPYTAKTSPYTEKTGIYGPLEKRNC